MPLPQQPHSAFARFLSGEPLAAHDDMASLERAIRINAPDAYAEAEMPSSRKGRFAQALARWLHRGVA